MWKRGHISQQDIYVEETVEQFWGDWVNYSCGRGVISRGLGGNYGPFGFNDKDKYIDW